MKKPKITIKEISLEEASEISKLLPEFPPYDIDYFKSRIGNSKPLVIGAYIDGEPAGYRIGFNRQKHLQSFDKSLIKEDVKNNSFYFDLGGVAPKFRKLRVMSQMYLFGEKKAKENGFKSISITTRNNRKPMITFLTKNNYLLWQVRTKKENISLPIEEYRLDYIKYL